MRLVRPTWNAKAVRRSSVVKAFLPLKRCVYIATIFCAALITWAWMWNLPIHLSQLTLEESGLGFDLFRYFDAATCVHTEDCFRAEIVATPVPVFWGYLFLFLGGAWALAIGQAAIYTFLCLRLLNATRKIRVPDSFILVSVLCPAVLMYVCMPSKEFFVLCGALVAITYAVETGRNGRLRFDFLLLVFGLAGIAVRPGFALALLSLWLAFRLPLRKSLRWTLLVMLVLALMPKDFEHFQLVNEAVPSHSAAMQTFRDLSAIDNPLVQLLLTPVRFVFYVLFPFPALTAAGLGLPDSGGDLELYFGLRQLSVETLNFLWFAGYGFALLLRKRRTLSDESWHVLKALALFSVFSILFLAAASPLPSARYRVVSLLGFSALLFVLFAARRTKKPSKQTGGKDSPGSSEPDQMP